MPFHQPPYPSGVKMVYVPMRDMDSKRILIPRMQPKCIRAFCCLSPSIGVYWKNVEKDRKVGESMTTTEKAKYPCKPATVEELDNMLNTLNRTLHTYLQNVSFREIDWSNVLHLRMIPEFSFSGRELRQFGIYSGSHLNQDGSWLLVIPPKNTLPEEYLNHCEPCLQTLSVRYFLDLSRLPGLEKLTHLTELNLSGCKRLTCRKISRWSDVGHTCAASLMKP